MKNGVIRTIVAFLAAILCVIGLAYTTESNLFLNNTIALWSIAFFYLFLFSCFVLFKWNVSQIKKLRSGKLRLVMASLFISVILLVIFPWKYGTVLTNNHVEKMRYTMHSVIISVQNQNMDSAGQEVWISAVKKNTQDFNMYEIPIDNQEWVFNEGAIYTDGKNKTNLVIDLGEGNLFDVKFKKTPMSGIVTIQSGQHEYSLDLYSEIQEEVYLDWTELYGNAITASQYKRILYYALYFAIIWSLVITGLIYLLSKYCAKTELKKKLENK